MIDDYLRIYIPCYKLVIYQQFCGFEGFEEVSLTMEKLHCIQVGSSEDMDQKDFSPKKWIV